MNQQIDNLKKQLIYEKVDTITKMQVVRIHLYLQWILNIPR